MAAANRDGGEDNITAVAFRISSEPAPNLEDTVAMPAIDDRADEPDEQTREYTEADPSGNTMIVAPAAVSEELSAAEPEAPRPVAHAGRVRIVLIGIVLLAIAAAIVIWVLSR